VWHKSCILEGGHDIGGTAADFVSHATLVGTLGHAMMGAPVLIHEDEGRLPRLLASSVAVLLVMAACMFHYLPRELAMIVTSWSMLSLSVGISFGHCVLNEP
jgi:hypothetical protein